jgi:hypothetical protein
MAYIRGAYGDNQAVAPSLLPYEELEEKRKDRNEAAKQLHQQRVDAVDEQVYEKNLSQAGVEYDAISKKIAPIYMPSAKLAYDEYFSDVLDAKSKSSNSFDPNAEYAKAAQKLGSQLDKYEQMSGLLYKNTGEILKSPNNYDPESVAAATAIQNANATGQSVHDLGDQLVKIPNTSNAFQYDAEQGTVMVNPVPVADADKYFTETLTGKNKLPVDPKTLQVTKGSDGEMYYITKPSQKAVDDKTNAIVQDNGIQSPLFRKFIADNYTNPEIWNGGGKAPVNEKGEWEQGSGGMSINYDKAVPAYKEWISGQVSYKAGQQVNFQKPATPAEKLAYQKYNEGTAEHSYDDLQRHATQLVNNAKYWISKLDSSALSGFSLTDEQKKDISDNYTKYVSVINNIVSEYHDKYSNNGQKISFSQFDQDLTENGVPDYFIKVINQQGSTAASSGKNDFSQYKRK